MFAPTITPLQPGRVTHYAFTSPDGPLTYRQVLDLWRTDADFQHQFTAVLAESPFPAFRWETPPITRRTVDRPFEFVLLHAPSFTTRGTDRTTYREHFAGDTQHRGAVAFTNLSGDAVLVVPTPQAAPDGQIDFDAYGHLAAFVRAAPQQQTRAFWQLVGETVADKLTERPLWLSTAGGGVAWLHARLDSRPKYYGHGPYRAA